jgi:DNA-directed RNA polymerase beta' subunit
MILKNILVVPPNNRPIIQNIKGEKSEDNLYKLYALIIKFNKILKDEIAKLGESSSFDAYQKIDGAFRSNFESLSVAISTMSNDKISKSGSTVISKSGKVHSIKEEIKGKKGFLRDKIMGKRVNNSGRTVIVPEANFDVHTFGIPELFAKILTFPDRVNKYNIEYLRSLILNGDEYPGASSVIFNINGKPRKTVLTKMSKTALKNCADKLTLGSIVNRHTIDGDYANFNRQPSLHKYSFMGVKVKIIPGHVIRVPYGSNTIFNADFDGDECQIHRPLSWSATNEVKNLMLISNHFLSFTNSEVHVGPLQDGVLGIYLLSKEGELLISKQTYMNYLISSGYFDMKKINPKKQYYKLIETIESLIPETFNINTFGINLEFGKFISMPAVKEEIVYDNIDNYINEVLLISDRKFREENVLRLIDEDFKKQKIKLNHSRLNKSNIRDGMIRTIFNDYGPLICNNFVSGLQKLSNRFLRDYGETCSVRDVVVPKSLKEKMKKNIENAHKEIEKLLNDFDEGKIIAPLTKTIKEYYEILVAEKTNPHMIENIKLLTDHLKEVQKTNLPNNLYNMVDSKSKGSQINIVNIVDNIGQTSINGKRIEKILQGRTLVSYPKYDESLESGGFISNSFVSGISGTEFFFHQKGAINGLIDSAIKVKNTGYATIRLGKNLEDIVLSYDNRVIRDKGQIIGEIFGTNGINPLFQTENNLALFTMTDEEFIKEFI